MLYPIYTFSLYLEITNTNHMGIIFLYAILWMPAIAAFIMGLLDVMEEKKFLKNATETKGRIVGTIGAKYKSSNQYGVDLAGTATAGAMTQYVKGEHLGGAFVIVEFEDQDGDTYSIRSKQPFGELKSDYVTVHYDAENPSNAVVDRFYSGNAKYYQMIGASVLFLIPILIHLFLEPVAP